MIASVRWRTRWVSLGREIKYLVLIQVGEDGEWLPNYLNEEDEEYEEEYGIYDEEELEEDLNFINDEVVFMIMIILNVNQAW